MNILAELRRPVGLRKVALAHLPLHCVIQGEKLAASFAWRGIAIVRSRRRRRLAPWRSAISYRRSTAADFALGLVLALVAGAINAGGFLAIGQFTSHMTGMIAMIADDITRGITGFIATGIIVITCFILGAAASTVLIAWGRRNRRTRQFVYPVVVEILLILAFGGVGLVSLRVPQIAMILMPMLGFMMGFQNATITRISDARIRTTHMTGMVTDIGMELGHVFSKSGPNWTSLRIHTGLVASFFIGSLLGGIGFLTIGFSFAFFVALPLVAIVILGFLSRRAKTRRKAR